MEGIQASVNKAIESPLGALFGLKFHQVAIYCDNPDRMIGWWSRRGYTNWSTDNAVLVGTDRCEHDVKEAYMAFNYDIIPMELEYVTYMGPRNRHDDRNGSTPFLSHMSTIVEDVDEAVFKAYRNFGLVPYHRFTTEQHTNPAVRGKKRFREAIFDTAGRIGFDIKLIERVPWDYEG